MGLVELKYRNTRINIVVDDESRVSAMAERFNNRIESLANTNHPGLNDARMAFLAGIMLEDEIDKLQAQLDEALLAASSEHKATDVVREALDQVSSYLENLAQRIENK